MEKVNLIADYVREARLEQSTNSDEEWVDSQVVCQYLRICEKTLQRLRAAGKVAYSCVGNKYYYQIAEVKRCLKAHLIKSSDEMLNDLIQHSGYTLRSSDGTPFKPARPLAFGGLFF